MTVDYPNVTASFFLNILDGVSQLLHALDTTAGKNGPANIIGVALHKYHGQVLGFLQITLSANKPRCDRYQAGPEVAVFGGEVQRTRAAHGMATKIDSLGINIEFSTNNRQHVHHIHFT